MATRFLAIESMGYGEAWPGQQSCPACARGGLCGCVRLGTVTAPEPAPWGPPAVPFPGIPARPSQGWICPKCGAGVNPEQTFCPRCSPVSAPAFKTSSV